MVSSCVQQLEDLKQRGIRGGLITMHVPWPYIEVCPCHWQCFTQTQSHPNNPTPHLTSPLYWIRIGLSVLMAERPEKIRFYQEKAFSARPQLKSSVIVYCFCHILICKGFAQKRVNNSLNYDFMILHSIPLEENLMKLIFNTGEKL